MGDAKLDKGSIGPPAGERLAGLPLWAVVGLVAVVVQVGLIGAHGVNSAFLGDGEMLALDREASVGTWVSTHLFFLAGAVALANAPLDPARRWLWVGIGVLFVGFSLDDIIQLHEAGEREVDSGFSFLGIQPLIVLIATVLLLRLRRGQAAPARALLAAAALALVAAFASSLLAAYVDLPHVLIVVASVAQETLETLMATALLCAAIAAISRIAEVRRRDAGAPAG